MSSIEEIEMLESFTKTGLPVNPEWVNEMLPALAIQALKDIEE